MLEIIQKSFKFFFFEIKKMISWNFFGKRLWGIFSFCMMSKSISGMWAFFWNGKLSNFFLFPFRLAFFLSFWEIWFWLSEEFLCKIFFKKFSRGGFETQLQKSFLFSKCLWKKNFFKFEKFIKLKDKKRKSENWARWQKK